MSEWLDYVNHLPKVRAATVSTAGQRVYAGATAQERAARRRAALIEATFTVVADQGWRQLSIERVCETAGLIRRYFYESFPDIDALAAATIETGTSELLALVLRHDLTAPPEELIHTLVDTVVGYATENPARVRVLFSELGSSETANAHRRAAIRRIVTVLATDSRTVLHADDPIFDLTASVLVNGTIRALIDWLDGTIAMSRTEFVDDTCALWIRTSEAVMTQVSQRTPGARQLRTTAEE